MAQTPVLFGRAGVATESRQAGALQIAVASFARKLNQDLREERQVSYGAKTSARSWKTGGLVSASTWIRSSTAAETVRAALDDLSTVRDLYLSSGPRSSRAHADAQASVLRSAAERLDGTLGLADAAAQLFLAGLPEGWPTTSLQRLQRTTAADVRAAVASYFDPKSMQLVLVGDPRILEAQAKAIDAAR